MLICEDCIRKLRDFLWLNSEPESRFETKCDICNGERFMVLDFKDSSVLFLRLLKEYLFVTGQLKKDD